jgi:hypothetical protein
MPQHDPSTKHSGAHRIIHCRLSVAPLHSTFLPSDANALLSPRPPSMCDHRGRSGARPFTSVQRKREQPARGGPDLECEYTPRRQEVVACAENVGGLSDRAVQALDGDILRKEDATVLIKHVKVKIGHSCAPMPCRREHTYLSAADALGRPFASDRIDGGPNRTQKQALIAVVSRHAPRPASGTKRNCCSLLRRAS